MADNVEFEVVKAEEIKFGKNNFFEVARKKAVTAEGATEFISVSRGFYLPDGTKRYKPRNISIPDDKEIRSALAKKIADL